MVEKHVSLPKPFSEGDLNLLWLSRFEICAAANGWNDEVKAAKLPTLLEGEALAVFLELEQDAHRKDYQMIKQYLQKAFHPVEAQFSVLQQFEKRRLLPGESPRMFLHNLRRTLVVAMPDLEDVSREKLLLHHFIAGLPDPYARQLRVIPEIKTLADALCRAQLLMGCNQDPAIREPKTAAAVAEPTRLEKLEEQNCLNV